MFLVRASSLLALSLSVTLSSPAQTSASGPLQISSPDGQIAFSLTDGPSGKSPAGLRYTVNFHGKQLIDESDLGLEIQGQPALGPGLHKVSGHPCNADETYTIPVGKTKSVRNHYNCVVEDFASDTGSKLSIEIRVFDDGLAFRYLVPEQPSIKSARITGELTQFHYSMDATLYPLVLKAFQSSYEDDYQMRTVSSIQPAWIVSLATACAGALGRLGRHHGSQHRQLFRPLSQATNNSTRSRPRSLPTSKIQRLPLKPRLHFNRPGAYS